MGREEDGAEDRGAKEEAIDRGCPCSWHKGKGDCGVKSTRFGEAGPGLGVG